MLFCIGTNTYNASAIISELPLWLFRIYWEKNRWGGIADSGKYFLICGKILTRHFAQFASWIHETSCM